MGQIFITWILDGRSQQDSGKLSTPPFSLSEAAHCSVYRSYLAGLLELLAQSTDDVILRYQMCMHRCTISCTSLTIPQLGALPVRHLMLRGGYPLLI